MNTFFSLPAQMIDAFANVWKCKNVKCKVLSGWVEKVIMPTSEKILGKCVRKLQRLTKKICKEKIESFI